MSFFLSIITSLSIGIAAIFAIWRFKYIHSVFRPFIYCIWLGLINEIISVILVRTGHGNAINSNIYVLLEALLVVWQFRKWGVLELHPWLFPSLLMLLVLAWIAENFMLSSIWQFSSWFRILYSFVIVLLSITGLNRQLIRERGNLLKNPVVLICLAYIVYYAYKILVETFWLYGLNESVTFRQKEYSILNYINLFSNFIYALAVLWMPTKRRFTLPY